MCKINDKKENFASICLVVYFFADIRGFPVFGVITENWYNNAFGGIFANHDFLGL